MMKKTLTKLIKNNYDKILLIAIIIFAVLFRLLLLGNEIAHGIVLSNTLDLSWQTDSIERLLHGYIAGRDFIFTYGPLFQFVYSLPAFLFNQPSYIAVLYAPVLLTIGNTLLLFLILQLTIQNKKTSLILSSLLLFVGNLIFYDPNSLVRILLPLFYGLLVFRFISIKKPISVTTVVILSLPALFGMYTFDLLFLCVLQTILFLAYELFTIYKNKKQKSQLVKYTIRGIIYLTIIGLATIGGSILLSGNLNYLLYSLDTVKNYQFVMSIPWTTNPYFLLLCIPFGLCILLLYVIRSKKIAKQLKTPFIVLAIAALLQIKAALIRSDDGHIIMGIYPSIIVLFILSYYVLREKIKYLLLFCITSFFLLMPLQNNSISDISFRSLGLAFNPEITSIPSLSLYKFSDNYYFTRKDLDEFASLITKNPGNVLVYPYDSYILNMYNQTYNILALQLYQYSNSLVEERTVENLKKSPPKFIILGIDDKGAVRLDNIVNFSRNPHIAKWMLENYSVDKKTEKYFILKLDPNKKNSQTSLCNIYGINTHEIMQTNFFEQLFKPSTYYLDSDTGIRLPYQPSSNEILIIGNVNNADVLEKLFNSKHDFEIGQKETKQLKIVKKFAIPKMSQIYEGNFSVTCYN